jgi:hypothetical protein
MYNFIKGISEFVSHSLRKFGLDILFTVPKRLDKLIKKGKDDLSTGEKN